MDPELIKYLDSGSKERLQGLEEMFNGKGWKIVTEWAEQQIQIAKSAALNSKSWAEHRLAIGSMGAMGSVANLEATVAAEFENIARTNQEQLAEKAEDEALEYE